MLEKVFKAYDIRALYPQPLDEEVAWRVGYGTAEFLVSRAAATGLDSPMARHVVVGRDMRRSSPSLSAALKQGIRDFGANIVDVGLVDTPFVYFAVNHLGCAGGVQVTASHNPPQYNGFKISQARAKPVGTGSGLERIRELAELADPARSARQGGREEPKDLWWAYRAHLLRLLDSHVLDGSARLRVVVDASNGMAGAAVPRVLDGVPGLELIKLNFDIASGEFAHDPNPLVEANLTQLKAAVAREGADFGVCFDGDADRCILVDEAGRTVGCDLLLAALVGDVLRENPGAAIVYDLRSSRAVAEAVRACGGVPVESRVGHVFMKSKLAETASPIGGELSGHFYFRDMWNTDSGLRTLIAALSLLARSGKTLGQLIEPLKAYSQSGEINFECPDKAAALAALRAAYPAARTAELDGLSLDNGDFWCNVRASNTEPLLRLNLEAADRATMERSLAAVAKHLGRQVAH